MITTILIVAALVCIRILCILLKRLYFHNLQIKDDKTRPRRFEFLKDKRNSLENKKPSATENIVSIKKLNP